MLLPIPSKPVEHIGLAKTVQPILFIDGEAKDAALLRRQVFDPVKAALGPSLTVADVSREEAENADGLRVSLSPTVHGDVLMMFDLADRNHFSQFDADGLPHVAAFSRVLVPGQWLARKLLRDDKLGLSPERVVAVGSPRIDVLRALQLARPTAPRAPDTPLRVLYVALHDNWSGREGQKMSVRDDMAPYLPQLEAVCTLRLEIDGRNTRTKKAMTEALLDADVVITDFTSIMYEAWALGKPVIFPHWLCADRLETKAPGSAEAYVYRERIGHHPQSFDEMLALLTQDAPLEMGSGAQAFINDYLTHAQEGSSGTMIAALLERLAIPGHCLLEERCRAALSAAVEDRDWVTADGLVSDLLSWNSTAADLHGVRAHIYRGQGKWWQEVAAREITTALNPAHGAEFYRLGVARERMGMNQGAAAAYGEAIRHSPKKADWNWYYRLGYMLETEGFDGPATHGPKVRMAYERASQMHPNKMARTLGVGFLHTEKGRWKEAQAPYRALRDKMPSSDEVHYRLGMAYDRCYDWDAAAGAYACAVELAPNEPYRHYRLGFVRERQGDFSGAADAYLRAVALSGNKHQAAWCYRAGYVLEKVGRLEEACAAFASCVAGAKTAIDVSHHLPPLQMQLTDQLRQDLDRDPENTDLMMTLSSALEHSGGLEEASAMATQAMLSTPEQNEDYVKRSTALSRKLHRRKTVSARLDHNCTNPCSWYRYSKLLEMEGNLSGAIAAARQVVMRSNTVSRKGQNRLGQLLTAAGHLQDACAAFRDQYVLQRPHGIYIDRFETGGPLNETATYREFYDLLPILPQSVMYESFSGATVSGNPLAIFNQIKDDPAFDGWLHIWVLNDLSRAPREMRYRRDVVFCTRESDLYKRYLATAQHVINNATFPYYYVRKEGQKYLNTWHGTPLKSLGIDIRDEPLARANTVRNFLHASHLLFPNAHTQDVMINRNKAARNITAHQQITGYPRIDAMLNATQVGKEALKARLGLDPNEKVVLYAPTYRGYWSSPEIEADALISTLSRLQQRCPNLLFRGHYFTENTISEMGLPYQTVPHSIDSCTLLSIVDVLITDYSSIYFDYLPSGKPILHLADDWDTYAEIRGVYFDKDVLPGRVCDTVDQLIDGVDLALRDPAELIDDTYRKAVAEFCLMEDGKSSERAVAFFFGLPTEPQKPYIEDRHISFYIGGVDKNGITASARSIMKGAAARGVATTAIVDRRFVANDPDKAMRMYDIAEEADVIIRSGRTCLTPEEAWISDKMNAMNTLYCDEMHLIYAHSTAHEFYRVMGHAHTDCILDFDGYSPYWSHLIAASPAPFKAQMLHNNMSAEMMQRFRHLSKAFEVYDRFDRLISVSDSVDTVNRDFFTRVYRLADEKFRAVPNTLDVAGIIGLVLDIPQADSDYDAMLADPRFKLINMARLSPEKNQIRLIDALAELVAQGHDVSLYILGKGPLLANLKEHITARRLNERVFMLGIKENPYPFLKAADCHVLSSNYEGQGIVLLEAMTLGVPSVSTDIPGPDSVLAGGRGILTEQNPQALAQGIIQVIKGQFHPAPFDAEGYNMAALDAFMAAMNLS